MRYEVRLSAYDVMDQVWIHGVLLSQEEACSTVLLPTVLVDTTVQGTGESDPNVWFRDVLVAALECL